MAMSTFNPLRSLYRAVGFSKGYNFWLWFVFGGFFLGFVVARLKYLDIYGVFCASSKGGKDAAPPGECFYYLQPGRYQSGIISHLYLILPASLLAFAQFIPIIRRKAMWFHRINGWIASVLALIGTVPAVVIARKAMGGGLDTQSMVFLQGVMFSTALVIGCFHAYRRNIAQHRAWMIRAWVYGGAIVTMRVMMFFYVVALSFAGGYYYPEPCEKVDWLLKGKNATLAAFPECASFYSGEDLNRHVAVYASVFAGNIVSRAAILNLVFGPSGWTGIFLNLFGVETYLYLESGGRNTKKSAVVKSRENGDAIKAD
ncbi:uncharacterized protein F4822DRAFT_414399 [Hypoxylon trugodes]|uniref:uncharacterized protein n=1 Tax=Hypoxylon trugodes TaxID=326681 RepID=UPI002194E23E|nr:uncharacterized protein F4822DRAFT_414399 [Hypoxylon trugodes]KAI1385891.1 hypothetical protein F4822DRAFT_414399 [Hypoxylon trugodes]